MAIQVLDPTVELKADISQAAPRLDSLKGKTVGFISNGKEGTEGFFRHLEALLIKTSGVAAVKLVIKSNYSAPADAYIIDEIKNWDIAVSGLGD